MNNTRSCSAAILRLLNAATIDTFGQWGFSVDIDAVNNPHGAIPRTYINTLKTTKHGQRFLFWAFTLGPDFVMNLPLRAVKILKALARFAGNTAEDLVRQHEAYVSGGSYPKSMLGTMMKSDYLSHKDLVNQSLHFVAAATETTAGTLGWAIHLISRHPEVQDRLREEIRAKLPSGFFNPELIDETSFRDTKYLDAVIKEVLRYHSINTILWREAILPANLANTAIPIGTKVVFSPWATGRDPAFWGPDARTFDPSRWLGDDAKKKEWSPYSFLTFGAGPRRCPGDEYAKAQMRCLIAGLVGRFEFSTEPDDERGSDDGVEVGDYCAFTLFKIMDGKMKVNIREIEV